jgi:hypothetical protein
MDLIQIIKTIMINHGQFFPLGNWLKAIGLDMSKWLDLIQVVQA